MSRRVCLLLLSLSAISAVLVSVAPGQFSGRLLSGGWAYKTTMQGVLADQSPVTGFAFGFGRNEVAFCAPVSEGGASALWLTEASTPPIPDFSKPSRPLAPSRLLWRAPIGTILRGPVVWSPNGAHIALLACRDTVSDLVAVDYATKEAVWITHDKRVTGVAWNPGGDRIAYVNEESGKAAVVLQTFPPGEPKRIGSGGINLRWSADGKALRWIEPTSEKAWTEMVYDPATGEANAGNVLPPRPAGAVWSPDGRRCAYLMDSAEAKSTQLVICQTEAVSAPPVPLPDLKLRQVLGWSPDGSLVLALDEKGTLYTVSARAPDEAAMAAVAKDFTKERAAAVDAVVVPTGPPSWSSSGEFLAYVLADENDPEYAWVKAVVKRTKRPIYVPFNKLMVMQFAREYIGPGPKTEREQIVANMKKIAIAVQMYMTDYDRFPPTDDIARIRDILNEYLEDRTVFYRPGTEDDVIVKYLLPPGLTIRDALQGRDPDAVPVAIVEYPTYSVIAYADGHVETVERK